MFLSLRRYLNYANVTATLALVFAMSGGALAATHYLIKSKKQISPKVLKELKGNRGATGSSGATGPAGPQGAHGATGAQGIPGTEGPQGPGASEISFNLPASTSPTFSKVGSAAGITLEADCEENAGTHAVVLNMTYTSTAPIALIQTEFASLNGAPTTTSTSSFTIPAAPTPEFWERVEAEKAKQSIERFNGNYLNPKVITSEGYVANGGPSGNCEAAIGFTPAS